MGKKTYGPYSLGIMVLIAMSITTPVFAEVTSMNVNSDTFFVGDKIKFSGTVEEDSTGLVTIVIRDPNNEFVLLSQATISPDYSFEKTIDVGNKFSTHGIHNATGFILNMTKGITNDFGVSLNGVPIVTENESTEESIIEEVVIEETSKIADFVDPNKDPEEYVYRYYTEAAYKVWFDKNYPGLTIEEAVGYVEEENKISTAVQDLIDKEIIPEAEATSIVVPVEENNNPEIAQISLAIAALGILFGAVYGVKRKVDDNSRQISINRETIRKKFIHPIMGDNPKDILQTRLAKGEITIEEYERLRMKLG